MIDEIRIETLEDAVENETAQTENEREENGCALTTPAMIALIEFIAKSLVDAPESVRVIEKESDETSVTLELSVAQDDMGKVIGCLLYTSPSPRDGRRSRMTSSA